jgi:hypothetical protein
MMAKLRAEFDASALDVDVGPAGDPDLFEERYRSSHLGT